MPELCIQGTRSLGYSREKLSHMPYSMRMIRVHHSGTLPLCRQETHQSTVTHHARYLGIRMLLVRVYVLDSINMSRYTSSLSRGHRLQSIWIPEYSAFKFGQTPEPLKIQMPRHMQDTRNKDTWVPAPSTVGPALKQPEDRCEAQLQQFAIHWWYDSFGCWFKDCVG